MKKIALAFVFAVLSAPALAQSPTPLSVTVAGLGADASIPARFAYCIPNASLHTMNGYNINPAISWSGAPFGVQSYALIVVDRDVPASFDLANQEGKTIPDALPRRDFYHWVLVDIPASITSIAEGADSKNIVAGGKNPGKTAYGVNGQNSYADSGKDKGGSYDGPCPPWNDERLHHYHFIVYALDVPTLGLSGAFTGQQAVAALAGHVLAQGEVVGTYTQNQSLLSK